MRIGYWLFSGFAWLVTLMPASLLYAFSGFAYLLLNHVIRYRKKIVKQNLKDSFPEMPDKEITDTANKYYQHLADLVIEVIKTPGLSASQIKKRFHFKNPEILTTLFSQGKSLIIL